MLLLKMICHADDGLTAYCENIKNIITDYGLWTMDYGLQSGYKKQTLYKTRTRYENVDCGLSLKNIALIVSRSNKSKYLSLRSRAI